MGFFNIRSGGTTTINGSTVTGNETNGYITINGTPVKVYDESILASSLSSKASIDDTSSFIDKTYSSNKINSLMTNKLNVGDSYTKTESDSNFASKSSEHTHSNKLVLDRLGVNTNNNLTIDGVEKLGGGTGGSTSMSGLSDVDVTTVSPIDGDFLQYQGGKWKPKSVSSYMLELSRWGVSNTYSNTSDDTLARNNSNGINNALVWASSQGHTEVVLPKGSYLLSEAISIQPQSYMTLNLNGSTLRIRDNREISYKMITFQSNQIHSRVTNGILAGDKLNHDYYYYDSTSPNPVGKSWSVWTPNTNYSVGDKVMPTNTVGDNYNVFFQCTTAGQSSATEPTWSLSPSTSTFTSNTTDGTVVWKTISRNTNEGGYAIVVGNVNIKGTDTGGNTRFVTVDNLEIYDFTGDGISIQSNFGQVTWADGQVSPVLESGGIYMGTTVSTWASSSYSVGSLVNVSGNVYQCTTKGAGTSTNQPNGTSKTATSYPDGYSWVYVTVGDLIIDSTRVRSTSTIKMSDAIISQHGYFGLYGNGYGNVGSGITATLYDVIFYNSDNSYNSCVQSVQFFDEVLIPSGASTAKVVLHQGILPPSPTNITNTINVRVPEFPKYTYVEKCNSHDHRRLALSITGSKYVYIRGNDFHHINATLPKGAIDIEDGYKLNQFIWIEDNNIHDTSTGLTIVNGRHINITGNRISDKITIWGNTDHVNMENNFIINSASVDLSGDVIFEGNRVINSMVTLDQLLSPATSWSSGAGHVVGDIVIPTTPNGYYYYCYSNATNSTTTASLAGTTEPSWTTTIGAIFTDNTLSWICYKTERDILVNNSVFHNSQIIFSKLAPYKAKITNCKFYNNQNKAIDALGLNYTFVFKFQPQIITDCLIEGDDVNYVFSVSQASTLRGGWIFENVKMTNISKSFSLIPATYTNCEFVNINYGYVYLGFTGMTESDYTFNGCKFTTTFTNINANLLAFNNARSVRMSNCSLQLQDGYAILIQNVTGDVILRGNRITYPSATSSKDIIQVQNSFTGTLIELDGNTITSVKSPLAFNNLITTNTSATVIVKGNTFVGATLNNNGKELKLNNIVSGTPDPYDSGVTANRPTNGNYINRRYFDTTLGKPIFWNGSTWVDATGVTV